VLYRIDLHGGVRMFAFISRRRGWQVRSFGDFEKALHWLSADDEKRNEDEGEAVPIKMPKATVTPVKPGKGVPIRYARYDRA
jgi:hypothetical protein